MSMKWNKKFVRLWIDIFIVVFRYGIEVNTETNYNIIKANDSGWDNKASLS